MNPTEYVLLSEFYPLVEKSPISFVDPTQSNQTRLMVKEPSLPINELLEKSSRTGESKFSLHPLPSAVWPKHNDLASVPRHHGPHNKSKRGPKSEHLLELNTDKTRGETAGLLPKPSLTASTAAAANRTAQSGISPPQPTQPEGYPNSRPRSTAHVQPAPAPSPRKDPPNRRLDPEENRPGKAGLYQTGIGAAPPRNNSRPPVTFNRRSSSLLYQFDILRRGQCSVLFLERYHITDLGIKIIPYCLWGLQFSQFEFSFGLLLWSLLILCFLPHSQNIR